MGQDTAVVIGDDPIDQLMKFQTEEHAEPMSRHFVTTDITEHVRAQHELWCREPQALRARRGPYNGMSVLESGQAPDLAGAHRSGWVSLAPDGVIAYACTRDIPDAFVHWFKGTGPWLKLKPGATGLSIDAEGRAETVTGNAGSARKGDVDLLGMRRPFEDEAAAWWDRAMAACNAMPWRSYREIWSQYESQPYSEATAFAAASQWASQPSVAAIVAATRIAKPSYMRLSHYDITPIRSMWNQDVAADIDRLSRSRAQYVAAHGLQLAMPHNVVIRDGELLEPHDETAFFDGLPDNALLTLAIYHC